MIESILEMFKTQSVYLFLGIGAYAMASLAVIMVSVKVNIFTLKETFDWKRLLNGLIEALLDAGSNFIQLLSVITLLVAADATGFMQTADIEKFGMVAILVVLGNGTIKKWYEYQKKQKDELGVPDFPESNDGITENNADITEEG